MRGTTTDVDSISFNKNAEYEEVTSETSSLQPLVKLNRRYLCRDARIVQVSFMDDDVSAELETKNNTEIVVLTAAVSGGMDFTGHGYVLNGSGEEITFKRPGQPSTQCKAS
ncbi:hypothetical protein D3Y57_04285 (plasmid) [Sphingomonas paeninsulae]|uniref:C-type lysozyme inhibitor domain-containing protein n=1 Tax=Sphingomonas paeninsulae TaxID=2319844 RepID=A0A494T8J5_SPHPE|nr:hypothetical protein [Sphingomonas paeninsulae]AYJ85250.1 hypothetical protein D3Y57_04285 [Sphingomonas paeninsulae]